MTPEELATLIEQLIINANAEYLRVIGAVERKLWEQFSYTLHQLQIDSSGYILQNAENRKIIQLAEGQFNATVKGSVYQGALQKYVNIIPQIDTLNSQYFQAVASKFIENNLFVRNIRKETVKTLETLILKEGVDVNVKRSLMGIVNKGINTGSSYEGMREEVKQFLVGKEERPGELTRYVTTITRDALFNYSRAYQNAASNDLGLEWYVWSGGLIKTSRPFCVSHADHYYHQREIEAFANQEWAGKRPGTTESSIFVYAGGYNCAHSIIPVHESIVPEEDKQRFEEFKTKNN